MTVDEQTEIDIILPTLGLEKTDASEKIYTVKTEKYKHPGEELLDILQKNKYTNVNIEIQKNVEKLLQECGNTLTNCNIRDICNEIFTTILFYWEINKLKRQENIINNIKEIELIIQNLLHILYIISSIYGWKCIQLYFPKKLQYINYISNYLINLNDDWKSLYILLLWFGIILLNPFSLQSLNTDNILIQNIVQCIEKRYTVVKKQPWIIDQELWPIINLSSEQVGVSLSVSLTQSESVPVLLSISLSLSAASTIILKPKSVEVKAKIITISPSFEYTNLCDKILQLGCLQLHDAGRCGEAGSHVLVSLLTRLDCQETYQIHFCTWIIKMIKYGNMSNIFYINLFRTLSKIIEQLSSNCIRDIVLYKLWYIFTLNIKEPRIKFENFFIECPILRRLYCKIIGRISFIFIPPHSKYITDTGIYFIEKVIDKLLLLIQDTKADVRWSAAKYICELIIKLPKYLGDQIFESIISPLEYSLYLHNDCLLHGTLLCLAILVRKNVLPRYVFFIVYISYYNYNILHIPT